MAEKEKKITLSEWENTACAAIRARQPGLIVQSLEEQRVIWSMVNICQYMAERGWKLRDVTVWSAVSSYKISTLDPDIDTQGASPLPGALRGFLDETTTDSEGKELPKPGVLILADLDAVLEMDPVESRRALREALFEISEKGMQKTIVIVGKKFSVPPELASEVRIMPYDLPTVAEIRDLCAGIVDDFKKAASHLHIDPSRGQIAAFARACGGLTESEARGLLRLAIAKYENLDERAVQLAIAEKAAIVRRGGALDVIEPNHGLDEVGGLMQLKTYLESVGKIINNPDEARAYGLIPPSGFLFTGTPGCGKSYTIEAIAKLWNLPLLKFDVGKAFGGLVGETEANIRQMQATAEAIKPCILYIDEIEKGLGGGQGEHDGGTSARVKQSLLTWLNDKSPEIIVAATANDLGALERMPELIRAGRFDEIFFVDLPDHRSRLEILAIHLKRAGHALSAKVLEPAAKASKGYSGAELKVAVQSALRKAFCENPRPKHPSGEMLVEAISEMIPLSVSMSESVRRLREWCKQGRARPAGPTLEDDASDMKSLKDHGLPILLSEAKK